MIKMNDKAEKTEQKTQTKNHDALKRVTTMGGIMDIDVQALVEKGKKRGYLTYEEMNNDLPEENLSPDHLDSLLMTLDDLGIDLIYEVDVKKRELDASKDDKGDRVKQDVQLEQVLTGGESDRRIDDPVRMYLTQMGEIPLLTRAREIA